MFNFLNNIRCPAKEVPVKKQFVNTVIIMFSGVLLGVISKCLDCTASNRLPFIIEYLDVTNFLGRLAVWVLIALCISVYSRSALRASVNVFVFFSGMVTSYYMYSKFIAGFFPKSYAMIWIVFTVISPVLAFICWYSKGESKISFIISAVIIAVLFNMTFLYGWLYFDIRSWLELLTFICGVYVMKRETIKETILMIIIGIIIAVIINMIIPFHFG